MVIIDIYTVGYSASTLSINTTTNIVSDVLDSSLTQKALAAGEYELLGMSSISSNSRAVYTENEIMSERVLITQDGRYSKSYELYEFSGVSYSSNSVSVITQYTNNAYEASMDTLRSGQSAYGVITIANAAASIVVPSTSYNENPTEWCEATNQVVFTTSSSISLGGIFSFSVNGSWTQYAIIRSSIVAIHAYAGYYL